MCESILSFGPNRGLVGVLHSPPSVPIHQTAVVTWNVGLNHRVGPSRAWVELARQLGQLGIGSLRFDLGGLGDSTPRTDPIGDIDRAVLDVGDALDALEALGWKRFILVSNCSGTDASHRVVAKDPRVIAAAYLDGYTYPTLRSTLMRRVGVYLSKRRWERWLRVKWPQRFGIPGLEPRDEIYVREYPTRERFERDLTTMVDRGVRLLFIYSGDSTYWYKGQFFDWLRRKDWNDRIRVVHYPHADHVYAHGVWRTEMLGEVKRFVVSVCRGVEPTSVSQGTTALEQPATVSSPDERLGQLSNCE